MFDNSILDTFLILLCVFTPYIFAITLCWQIITKKPKNLDDNFFKSASNFLFMGYFLLWFGLDYMRGLNSYFKYFFEKNEQHGEYAFNIFMIFFLSYSLMALYVSIKNFNRNIKKYFKE